MRRSTASRAGRAGALVVCAVLVAVSCGPQQASSAAPSAASVSTPAPTASPASAYADTLRVGWNPGLLAGTTPSTPAAFAFRGVPESVWQPRINFGAVVYSGLYRYDARYQSVPDLADGPCFVPAADGRVLRCRLIETTFHDGTPLTADDVAYTYFLFQQLGLMPGTLSEVRVVDPRTVDFVLSSVDPTLTEVLTAPIFARHAVEVAYTDFVERTKDLTAADLTTLVDTIDGELGLDPPACSSARLDDVDALLAKLGAHLYREDFVASGGTFDPCWYLQHAAEELSTAAAALGATGPHAVAVVWLFLSVFRSLVGTGPYRLVSESAEWVHLEAWPGYHGGPAATANLDFVRAKGDGSDLEAGALDILQGAGLDSTFRAAAAAHGIRAATPPDLVWYDLVFNARPGRLFADVALRRALQLCIDLPRDVDAATGGAGIPVYGPVPPGSWGSDPALSAPARDVAAAKALIESAGWQPGPDGTYARDGMRLAAPILVRANKPDRVKMADLIALQARDCGMDIQSLPESFDDLLAMLGKYPHVIPGTATPFDLYLAGTMVGDVDPSYGLSGFASSQVTDTKHPDGTDPTTSNFGGFSDPAFDRLLDAGSATYDQAERTSIYRQAQEELAAQVPAIFLWSDTRYDAVRSAVSTVDGPLDLSVPNWAWQPERLVVAANP
jgi:ABC-type transport system substrate-binding protein